MLSKHFALSAPPRRQVDGCVRCSAQGHQRDPETARPHPRSAHEFAAAFPIIPCRRYETLGSAFLADALEEFAEVIFRVARLSPKSWICCATSSRMPSALSAALIHPLMRRQAEKSSVTADTHQFPTHGRSAGTDPTSASASWRAVRKNRICAL